MGLYDMDTISNIFCIIYDNDIGSNCFGTSSISLILNYSTIVKQSGTTSAKHSSFFQNFLSN